MANIPEGRDGGPAFPCIDRSGYGYTGVSLRVYLAAQAPKPTPEAIKAQAERDAQLNPHGDNYKPYRRSTLEIEWDLRMAWADAGIDAAEREPR